MAKRTLSDMDPVPVTTRPLQASDRDRVLDVDLSDTRRPGAVIFDMDGVILDSNETWDAVMGELFAAHGKSLSDLDPDAFMGGDNSMQWAAYLKKLLSLPLSEEEIVARVVAGIISHFSEAVPLIPGAAEALARVGLPLSARAGQLLAPRGHRLRSATLRSRAILRGLGLVRRCRLRETGSRCLSPLLPVCSGGTGDLCRSRGLPVGDQSREGGRHEGGRGPRRSLPPRR